MSRSSGNCKLFVLNARLRYILLILVCSLFSQCHVFEHQIVDGGPCSYSTKIYPAKIIGFKTNDSINWDLVFERTRDSKVDSFTYSSTTNHYILKEDLPKHKLGNSYQWKEMKIIEGHCTPQVNFLMMQPCDSTLIK